MNLKEILRSDVTLLDVRSPEEFAKGAFPNSINIPLLDNAQRKQVGTCFKAMGRQAAIDLGNQLISPEVKASRIKNWLDTLDRHKDTYLYCWRGGLRSKTVQQWLLDAGRSVPVIPGGFKALRTCCLEYFASPPAQQEILIIAGRTGSGKTPFINQFSNSIDLEALANHRGSAFGRQSSEQPVTINFEHALARKLLQQQSRTRIILEDESRIIGRLAVPENLFRRMSQASILVLESPLEDRSERIFEEYVCQALANPESNREQLGQHYLDALQRINRRLGGQRCDDIAVSLSKAFSLDTAAPLFREKHIVWIQKLLNWYYDPMYDFQLARKHDRVILTGDCSTISDYLLQKT